MKYLIGMLAVFSVVLLGRTVTFGAQTLSFSLEVEYDQKSAREMLSMINDFRASGSWVWNSTNTEKISVPASQKLVYDYELEKVAMQRAAELAVYFSHNRPTDTSCFSAYKEQGYTFVIAGENLAAGRYAYADVKAVFEGLKEDNVLYNGQGHRRTMLNDEFTSVGIAHVILNGCHYWVQEFACPKSTDKSTYTKPFSGKKLCTISVHTKYIQSIRIRKTLPVFHKDESYSMDDLVAYDLTVNGTWPKSITEPFHIWIHSKWNTENKQLAYVKSNTLQLKDYGTTCLTTSILGKTYSLKVKVIKRKSSTITLTAHNYSYNRKNREIAAAKVTGSSGKVRYVYFTDAKCKVKTTEASGAISVGGAPKYCGTYYVKARVCKDDYYKGAVSKPVKMIIKRAANKITASVVSITLSKASLARSSDYFYLKAKAKGIATISYVMLNTQSRILKYFKVSKKGKVVLAKNTPKGRYRLSIQATSSQTPNYKKTVTSYEVTVRVA